MQKINKDRNPTFTDFYPADIHRVQHPQKHHRLSSQKGCARQHPAGQIPE